MLQWRFCEVDLSKHESRERYQFPGDYTGMKTHKACRACVCGCLCENTHTHTYTQKVMNVCLCWESAFVHEARACVCACIYKLCAWASGLCTSECWHQIRVFIITAELIMREDSRDRHRLGKHWSAERHGTSCLLCIHYLWARQTRQRKHISRIICGRLIHQTVEAAYTHTLSVCYFLPEV